MSTRPLVLLAHGSRRPGPSSVLSRTAERVGTILPGVEVRTGYVELQSPDPATTLEGLVDPVVLPFFLARGYHVVHDVPAAVERHGSGTVTGHLGVEEHLVEAVTQRLQEASAPLGGLPGLDHIVLGAAGSRQAAALEEVEAITHLLEARLGRKVTPAYLSAARPSVRDAVSSARAQGARRVGVATYLLAEGRFHRTLHSTGADVVAAPIGDHPAVAELVALRYREQVA
ncbi:MULTISPECIES: sirohydrochlorin chelatase [Actinomyces]|uniref:sirohydrochlorin chelatase n=1 Tax=Actinomyces TaxID=1654 RepID=UPI000C76475B|nr:MULTISPECIES: sirohydrochlorin chelatase [Actinomyces]PKY74020.1 sirohydrochlorin cobaltochelatase [Actinomyces oris]QQQ58545.1 sirohydrochlorin chelatase [Actinomyces sp. HMT 175]